MQLSATETESISHKILTWLRAKDPEIEFEYLPPERSGISITTIQGAYKTAEYIDGSFEAQYKFGILFRSLPTDSGERLNAEAKLNDLGTWAEANYPDLGAERKTIDVRRTSVACLLAKYEDGTEDYQILMTIDYEVTQ